MVSELLRLGANPHKSCQNGRTALFWAEQLMHEEMADELRLHGVRPWEEGMDAGDDCIHDHLEVRQRLPTP